MLYFKLYNFFIQYIFILLNILILLCFQEGLYLKIIYFLFVFILRIVSLIVLTILSTFLSCRRFLCFLLREFEVLRLVTFTRILSRISLTLTALHLCFTC